MKNTKPHLNIGKPANPLLSAMLARLSSAQAIVEDHGASQLVGSGSGVGPLAKRYWKAPFRYDAAGAIIWDASGERALDVRGWGRLTGKGSGALALTEDEAAKAQDQFGESVVRILNASWPNIPDEPTRGASDKPKTK